MNFDIFIRLFLCVVLIGTLLYAYIDKQNRITELRLLIPAVSTQLQAVEQENTRLQFEIDRFEDPVHLMELARLPQFSHLKHPIVNEIITIHVPRSKEGR